MRRPQFRAPRRPFLRVAAAAGALLSATLLPACTVSVEKGSQAPPETRAIAAADVATIDAWAEEAIASGRVAGISLAVVRDGSDVLARGYGFADLENDVPATPETVYRIGSITKQFTAAVILQLVESGDVELDAEIGRYVDYPTGEHTVTVRQLLDHTSGIPSYTSQGEAFWAKSRLDLSHEELLALVRDLPFDFAPGARWSYNNTGYYLLGMIIESVTGQSYSDVVQERLFGPLGLEHTTYCDERKLIENRAEGYEIEDGALVNDAPLSMKPPFAAGALCSTVLDLLEWQEALESGQVVSDASYKAMTTAGVSEEGPHEYGLGLGVSALDGHRKISHGGGINGFVTMLARYPDDDLGIVVLTNTPGPTASRLEENIARLLLGLEIVEIEELPLDEAEGAAYVGLYDLGDLQIRVLWSDGRLWARTGEDETTGLRYLGEDTFVPDFDDTVRLVFHRDGQQVTGLTLFQGDTETAGSRVE